MFSIRKIGVYKLPMVTVVLSETEFTSIRERHSACVTSSDRDQNMLPKIIAAWRNSAMACTLAMPVPCPDKGGGRCARSFLPHPSRTVYYRSSQDRITHCAICAIAWAPAVGRPVTGFLIFLFKKWYKKWKNGNIEKVKLMRKIKYLK